MTWLAIFAGASIASALAPQPTPILEVEAARSLRPAVGEVTRLRLRANGHGWSTASVGRLIVRAPGLQESIPVTPAKDPTVIEHAFTRPGPTMVVVSAGPPSSNPDTWSGATHTSKVFLTVEGSAASTAIDPGTTAKVGLPVELLPLVSPMRARVGIDFPVRAYFHNGKQAGVEIRAHRPGGTVDLATTDAVGTTNFHLSEPGLWVIRFRKQHRGTAHVAELVFRVPPGGGGQ